MDRHIDWYKSEVKTDIYISRACSFPSPVRCRCCVDHNNPYDLEVPKVLLAWLGQTDLDCSTGKKPGAGPTASVLDARTFDAVVLLSNYDEGESRAYSEWLEERGGPPIHLRHETLDDPTDFHEIVAAVERAIEFTHAEFGEGADLTIHISPGTPSMQAAWILLAKTRFPAELIQSSVQRGVRSVTFPFDLAAEYVPRVLRRTDEKLELLTAGLPPEAPEFAQIIGRSPAIGRAIARARRVAPHDTTVLIEGESGTGKELFARAIHAASRRFEKPFEDVNCGALPEGLVESLLFGHEKGAFSGATKRHIGHFEAADGGTLFLDEIGELPLGAQTKILRALQERAIRRVGGTEPVQLDVRIIAATNRNLRAEVAAGRFREDLYYRLATGVLRLPPLRERQGDLTPLLDHFLADANQKFADQPAFEQKTLSPQARNLLLRHEWSGNVRELQATMDRLVLWTPGTKVGAEDVREQLLQPIQGKPTDLLGRPLGEELQLPDLMAELAKHYLVRALEESEGNKTKAAELVGLPSYQTFTNWMEKYGVKAPKKAGDR